MLSNAISLALQSHLGVMQRHLGATQWHLRVAQ
jgi:hypothetical protein